MYNAKAWREECARAHCSIISLGEPLIRMTGYFRPRSLAISYLASPFLLGRARWCEEARFAFRADDWVPMGVAHFKRLRINYRGSAGLWFLRASKSIGPDCPGGMKRFFFSWDESVWWEMTRNYFSSLWSLVISSVILALDHFTFKIHVLFLFSVVTNGNDVKTNLLENFHRRN